MLSGEWNPTTASALRRAGFTGLGEGFMRRAAVWMGLAFVLALASMCSVQAQDVKGARDHPPFKRFPGSTIVRYEHSPAATYTLPTGPVLKWDYTRSLPDFGGRKLDID